MVFDSALVTPIIAIAGAALGLWWRIEARVTAERQERQQDARRLAADLMALRERFNAFELDVTKNFVPSSYQEKMEIRFLGSIDKLTGRLEIVIARIEAMGNQLTKISTTVAKVDEAVNSGQA